MSEGSYPDSVPADAFNRAGFFLDREEAAERKRRREKALQDQLAAESAQEQEEAAEKRRAQEQALELPQQEAVMQLYGKCGPGVVDLGDYISMKCKRGMPTKEQLQALITRAMEKGWVELYVYDSKGRPDPRMAEMINQMIIVMGVQRQISCCTDPAVLKDFWLKKQELSGDVQQDARADTESQESTQARDLDIRQSSSQAPSIRVPQLRAA